MVSQQGHGVSTKHKSIRHDQSPCAKTNASIEDDIRGNFKYETNVSSLDNKNCLDEAVKYMGQYTALHRRRSRPVVALSSYKMHSFE